MSQDSHLDSLSLLREILLRRPWIRMAIILVSLAAAFCSLVSPLFQKAFIDGLIHAPPTLQLSALQDIPLPLLIVCSFLLSLAGFFLNTLSNYTGFIEGVRIQRELSLMLYRKMLGQKQESYGKRTVGEVVAIYATDVPGSTTLIDQCFPMVVGIFFPLLIAPIVVKWLCGIEVLATASLIICLVFMYVILATRQSRFFHKFKQLAADRTGIVNEWIQNIRLLRILGWTEKFEEKIFAKRIEETANRVSMVTNGQFMASIGSSVSFLVNLAGVATLVMLQKQPPTPGVLFALLWIFGILLARPLRQIPWVFTFILDALTSIRRVESFLRERSPHDETAIELEASRPATNEKPALYVRNLCLRMGERRLLENISFDIQPGEFVGIVGEIGSGKSLLVYSLMGETSSQFDHFRIGSEDVSQMTLHQRRQYFSFVPQDGFVMSASLRENVAFQYDVHTDLDLSIQEALQAAQFDLRTERLAEGLNTEIGERGVNLSGGQRQRVSLARAQFLSKPIILLDDCLSAVDVDTEEKLVESLLRGAWKNSTRLLVTHRLSVLEHVDRIFFMKEGRIHQIGSLRELLAKSEDFRQFVESLLRDQESTGVGIKAIEEEAHV